MKECLALNPMQQVQTNGIIRRSLCNDSSTPTRGQGKARTSVLEFAKSRGQGTIEIRTYR